MKVKIDTKEKFHVITIQEESLSANMTAELGNMMLSTLQNDVKSVVIKMNDVNKIDATTAETLAKTQQQFYEHNASFVVCDLKESVKKQLEEMDLIDILNITPSESEAWDIVQMEEIERELLNGED